MLSKLHNYIKEEKRSLITALIAILVIVACYTCYLKFIGLPMTRARNKYNEGVLLMTIGAKIEAKAKFTESLSYWKTPEAEAELQKLSAD